jgi:hypothetical protein
VLVWVCVFVSVNCVCMRACVIVFCCNVHDTETCQICP